MEKYSKWRDPGTGVHPFLPNKGQLDYDNALWKVLWELKRLLIGSLLIILRLPFILIVFVWLLLFTFLAELIPISIIRRVFKKYIQFLGARILLLLLGFWWIESKNFHISRQKRDGQVKNTSPGSGINNGDIIIANHTSYVDILYFAFRFSPVFTATPTVWDNEPPRGVVSRRGLVGALIDSISVKSHKDNKSILEVATQAYSHSEGPVVVFPEGTTTNGRLVLATIPVLATSAPLPAHCNVHVVGLKYDYEDFSPSFTVASFLWHFLRLIAQVHNKLEVRYLSRADFPKLPLDESSREPTNDDREEWGSSVMRSLAGVLQIRTASLNVQDKREFVAYWDSQKKSSKSKTKTS